MRRLLLHVTDLDGWVWFNRIESMTIDEMVGRLLRTEPPKEQMAIGTIWHSIVEDPPDTIDCIKRDGYEFVMEYNGELVLPQIREIRANKSYQIDGVTVTLTGGTDGISGNKVTDHKLSFRPNPENYFGAYQWKAYLDIYNADSFEYIIYHAKQKGNVITINDISKLTLYRYPGMVSDLKRGIKELLGFIKEYVPQMIK